MTESRTETEQEVETAETALPAEDTTTAEAAETVEPATATGEEPVAAESEAVPEEVAPAPPVAPTVAELQSALDPIEPGPASPLPDGTAITYLQADREGQASLWICPIADGPMRGIQLPFMPEDDAEGPRISRDGKIALLVGRDLVGGTRSIWSVDIKSGECQPLLSQPVDHWDPRWSPDGQSIAFVAGRTGSSAIGLLNTGNDRPVQLTNPLPGQLDSTPTWSNEGTRIAFRRVSVEGEASGDHIWTVAVANGELKQATKKQGDRRHLTWMPGREQIAYVTSESEWENIGVVNPDNQSSWNLASESGDKSAPSFSPDGKRMMYIRRHQGSARLCERSTSGASADVLDPGDGEASAPRWIDEQRIVYRFSPVDGETRFIVQDAKKDVERAELLPAVAWTPPDGLVRPTHIEIDTGHGLKLGGWLYKPAADLAPAVLYLGDQPHRPHNTGFSPVEQALAASGCVVLSPSLPGTAGYGKKITNALSLMTSADAELATLLALINWLREQVGVDRNRIAIAGSGFGGGLALLLAGGRPGNVSAVAAIDPVIDLGDELNSGDSVWRSWQLRNFGLPIANLARTTMQSPETFAGTVDSPLLLVSSGNADASRSAQAERYAETLSSLEIPFERQTAASESRWDTANRVVAFLRGVWAG